MIRLRPRRNRVSAGIRSLVRLAARMPASRAAASTSPFGVSSSSRIRPAITPPTMKKIVTEIMYRMPDFRSLLRTYIWQDYDLAPKFPKLIKFLDFWSHNLDGPLASVRVAHAGIVRPVELRHVGAEWKLH